MTARTYRFSPPDRTGWLLGLTGAQLGVLGAAVVVSILLASARVPLAAMAAPLALGAAAAFVRVGSRPLVEALPPAVQFAARRAAGRHRWLAPLPLPAIGLTPPLPPCFDGQFVFEVGGVAVVVDRRTGRYAATLRAAGNGFALAERAEQERLLGGWGDALAPFCRDRGPVVALRWAEWAVPAGIEEQLAFLAEHGIADDADPAAVSYRLLVESAGPLGMRHDTLITLVAGAERLTTAARGQAARDQACAEALLAELSMFSARLETAGLTVGDPLTPGELGRALRTRLDPTTLPGLDRRGRTLGQLAGLVAPRQAGPLATEATWSGWRADGSWHRGLWICDWPRTDVAPDWLAGLLLARVGVRTIAVWCEPVAPRQSRRAIERAAAKLDADEEQRARVGLRIGAGHRRAQTAVAEREAELVSGYPEFTYSGLVTVTAPDVATLDASTAEAVQTAAAAGIDLRPLHGRHDQAAAAVLPLARGLAPRLAP